MRRGLVVLTIAGALIAPVVAAARPPFRQACTASWVSDGFEDWGSSWMVSFDGSMSCGFDMPTTRTSQMTLRIFKDQCDAGRAVGAVEMRADGQDVWSPVELDWAPGAGALIFSNPAGHGAAWVTPQFDIHAVSTCPVAYAITSAFVYNSLDGIEIPPVR